MRAVLSAAALCLALAAPAVAQTPAATRLVLADADRAPTRATIIDGASWRCAVPKHHKPFTIAFH